MSDLVFPAEGAPLSQFSARPEARDAERLKRELGDAFLLHHGVAAPAMGPMRTRDVKSADLMRETSFVTLFALRRQPTSEHAFISVGRVDGNDVVIRDETVSKFHAFFKETPQGLVLQDGRSRNGTFVDDKAVAARGAGPGTVVTVGQSLRFGSVSTVLLDAARVVDLVRRAS